MRIKKLVLFLVIGLLFNETYAQLNWPNVTLSSRPWTRWWWEGSAVDKAGITWNLEQYKDAGLGGVELTPIYGVYGHEKDFVDFLSPKWMELFDHTLRESLRLGVGVDLANGTGWPFGGPWVTDQDASKSIYYKTYKLKGGDHLKESIQFHQPSLVRTANGQNVNADTLIQPVSKNKNLQALALDQIQYEADLPLKTLMAYSGNKQAIEIPLEKVDKSGKLNWTAPSGEWTIYALFEGLHGKMVERAAPGGEGYAIDHFSLQASNNYFKRFDSAFKGKDISPLRSFFNDSYEVDDARGQANWTPTFFAEFKKRKGYDLKKYLPALFGRGSDEMNRRIIYDYRSVIDELLLEHFTMVWKNWAFGKRKLVRNQSHGSPANTLDLYSVVDIPETEGTDILRFKFASSAGNVSGKRLISSESATWLNEHFLSSWGDVKKAIDLYFLGGVNHVFYHGTEYSPKDAAWPGWLFYAAVHFQPTNPQWKDFKTLNTYITRTQTFLQSGKPDNDVLVYYPIIDRYSEPGTALLQHFDGMEKNFDKTDFEEVSKWMLDNGYAFDFFSDRQLKKFTVSGSKIVSSGNSFQTILLPANKLISEQSFQQMLQLVTQGATLLVYKELPQDIPGFSNIATRQKSFKQLVSALKFEKEGSVQICNKGKGRIYLGDDISTLLSAAKIRKEDAHTQKLSLIRRSNGNEHIYFINNRTDSSIEAWVKLSTEATEYGLFDPMTGNTGIGKIRKNEKGETEIFIQLNSFESVIVQCYTQQVASKEFPYMNKIGAGYTLKGNWSLQFLDGGPTLPDSIKMTELKSWTETSEAAKNFSGTAKYTIEFTTPWGPAGTKGAWILDLGKVHETAEVFLNGKRLVTLIGPVYQVIIPYEHFSYKKNKLEIVVANLMANRISYMDRNNIPWKIFYNTNMPARKRENVKDGLFNASAWQPLPSGLLGPVTLTATQ